MSRGSGMSPALRVAVFKPKATHVYKPNFKLGLDSELRFAREGSDFSYV